MKLGILISASALMLSTSTNAALIERLGGLAYYDDVQNITWLTDANLADSNDFGVTGIATDGSLNWNTANNMAAAMNNDGYLGVNSWNPATRDQLLDLRNNTLGNPSVIGQGHLNNTGPFINLLGEGYWSSSENSITEAFMVGFGDGDNSSVNKNELAYSMFIVSGDISAVPVPAAVWLFGSGLIGLAGFARRKKV